MSYMTTLNNTNMAVINEYTVKQKILEEVEKLLISHTSLDYINKTEFPNIIDELSVKLDKILTNDKP